MGHTSVKQTEVYAQILNEELDKAMDIFNEPKKDETFQCFTYVVPEKKSALQKIYLQSAMQIFCDPAGTRTQGPNIKSVVLYQLSYEINRIYFLMECKNKT
jgi:hypothetical protein